MVGHGKLENGSTFIATSLYGKNLKEASKLEKRNYNISEVIVIGK